MACSAALANGGIVTDGTVGIAGHLGAPQTLSGSDVKITQDMGTTAGHNVFQSFKEFNIGSGQTVTFSENSAGFINNIIARVTGKETSNINGTLRVTPEGHANFYLLNPNGVLFGSGAHIDVPGDFHVTTAHFIKFQDGAKYGVGPVHSHLSTTEPASFGFSSGTHSNNVLIDVTDGAQLKNPTTPNTAIDLVAENIKIENGAAVSANDVRLVAAKGNTSVSLSHDVYGNLLLPKFAPTAMNAGKVQINGGDTTVTSSGDGGGRIAMWGENITFSNGVTVTSSNHSDVSANHSQGITIRSANLSLFNSSSLRSYANAGGTGAAIDVYASEKISLRSGSLLTTSSLSSGDSGGLHVNSGGHIYMNNSIIESSSSETGSSGRINIYSEDLTMKSMSFIDSTINEGARSLTHGIFINIKNNLTQSNSRIYIEDNSNEYIPHWLDKGITINAYNLSLGDSSSIYIFNDSTARQGGIKINTEYGLTISGKSIITGITKSAPIPVSITSHGGIVIAGESNISTTFGTSLKPLLYIGADTLLLSDKSSIGNAAAGGKGNIFFKINGLFSSGNKLNGTAFSGGDTTIPNSSSYSKNSNSIAAFNKGAQIVISGSLLNLSGDMANLPPANFQSKQIANSCEAANRGSLSLTGKGRTASSALDRLIYGY